MDLIGCANVCSDFAVVGTSNEQLYGMCEALWKPDLVSGFFLIFLKALN
jgi:20S proteasome subunit beta 3